MADTDDDQLDLADADLSRTVLRQIAAGATTARWGYCPNCHTKVQTDVPDTAARVAAAKALGSDTDTALDEIRRRDPATYTPAERATLTEWAHNQGAPLPSSLTTQQASSRQQQQHTAPNPGDPGAAAASGARV